MKSIVRRELKSYLKNPLVWIALLVILVGLYRELSPYLKLHYFESEQEIASIHANHLNDADVSEGYIPSTEKQKLELWGQEIKETLMQEMGMPEERAEQAIEQIQKGKMMVKEAGRYLEEQYGYYGAEYTFYHNSVQYRRGSLEEVNGYIAGKMEQKPYTYYFAKKFVDLCGVYMGFSASVLLAFLFLWDTRKGTYELLHTKPISAASYVCGKACGGFSTVLVMLILLNIVFGCLCWIHGKEAGLPVRIWDLPMATLIYIVPNMLMILSVYVVIALLFKNPLPAAPLLFLYMVYSNMGSENAEGVYGYYGRALAIIVRFPGKLLEATPPQMIFLNQIFLLAASALLTTLAVRVWKRRRVF